MLLAPIPDDEAERMASLRAMRLLSTPDEKKFDHITRLAQRVFKVPIVLLSLTDQDRQWFKSCIGLPVREARRDLSLSAHAISDEGIMQVRDARLDLRFANNPLVTSAPNIVFYAGRPLKNADGYLIGTLCLMDHQPRDLTKKQLEILNRLGQRIEREFLNGYFSTTQTLRLNTQGTMRPPMLHTWSQSAEIKVLREEVLRKGVLMAMDAKEKVTAMIIRLDKLQLICAALDSPWRDEVLIEIIRRVKRQLGPNDSLGWCNTGELTVVMPGISRETASKRSEQLLSDLRSVISKYSNIELAIANCIDLVYFSFDLGSQGIQELNAMLNQSEQYVPLPIKKNLNWEVPRASWD